MKKTRNANGITIECDSRGRYINASQAIMAAQMMQMNMALQGYLVTSHIDTETGTVEITVHFSDKPYPKTLDGYTYTKKRITSHEYYSDYEKAPSRTRCVEYRFEYEK